MLKLFVHKQEVDIKLSKFPAGETMLSIEERTIKLLDREPLHAKITLKYESNDDLINLLLLTDAVRRSYPGVRLALEVFYFPYARQDRVCNKGESLSVKVIADLINSQNYDAVFTMDAHSEVTPALLNNCTNITLSNAAWRLDQIINPANTILVSPDAGANKKVYQFAKDHKFTDVVRADKTRDVASGKITGTTVYFHDWYKTTPLKDRELDKHDFAITNKDFLILDDICDGGYTFTQLAKELRKYTTGKIYLYVTHGIFSKGLQVLADSGIETIYTANNMSKFNAAQDNTEHRNLYVFVKTI